MSGIGHANHNSQFLLDLVNFYKNNKKTIQPYDKNEINTFCNRVFKLEDKKFTDIYDNPEENGNPEEITKIESIINKIGEKNKIEEANLRNNKEKGEKRSAYESSDAARVKMYESQKKHYQSQGDYESQLTHGLKRYGDGTTGGKKKSKKEEK